MKRCRNKGKSTNAYLSSSSKSWKKEMWKKETAYLQAAQSPPNLHWSCTVLSWAAAGELLRLITQSGTNYLGSLKCTPVNLIITQIKNTLLGMPEWALSLTETFLGKKPTSLL